MRLTIEELGKLPVGQALWLFEVQNGEERKFEAIIKMKLRRDRLDLDVNRGDRFWDRLVWSVTRNGPMRDEGPLVTQGSYLQLREI